MVSLLKTMVMSDDETQSAFHPPLDWEPIYAADPDGFRFGTEPSQIARSALTYFNAFGGDSAQSVALDLGSGEGRDTVFLASAGFHVVARDIAPTGLVKTRLRLEKAGIPLERADLAVGDVREYTYPEAQFDLALAANVYQFLEPSEVPVHLRRLQGTVKPGGICAVGVFSPKMLAWGADLTDHFTATSDALADFFPSSEGWLLLDRTDYATYRVAEKATASFAFIVARKAPNEL